MSITWNTAKGIECSSLLRKIKNVLTGWNYEVTSKMTEFSERKKYVL